MHSKVGAKRAGPLAARLAVALWLVGAGAHGASIEARCPGLPVNIAGELEARTSGLFASAGMRSATIGLECDGVGAWVVWIDGSRALVDQTAGLVHGVVAVVEQRIAYNRQLAAHPTALAYAAPGSVPRTDLETPPNDDAPLAPPKRSRAAAIEGGIGAAMMTDFWSNAGVGLGPRLEVSVGPPGLLALVLAEGMLFGVGSARSSQVTMFDFQAGLAVGAPYKRTSGFGSVLLFGAERISAANVTSDIGGLWQWVATMNLGVRGSMQVSATSLWLGADLALRTSGFEVGGPAPIRIPTSSFTLSLGGFFQAFSGGGNATTPARASR